MRVTIQIFNAAFETLETKKCGCHSLGYQTSGCVINVKSTHNSNVQQIARLFFITLSNPLPDGSSISKIKKLFQIEISFRSQIIL